MAGGDRQKRQRTALPHGAVPFHHIADQQARDAVMKLNENIVNMARRLADLERRAAKERSS